MYLFFYAAMPRKATTLTFCMRFSMMAFVMSFPGQAQKVLLITAINQQCQTGSAFCERIFTNNMSRLSFSLSLFSALAFLSQCPSGDKKNISLWNVVIIMLLII